MIDVLKVWSDSFTLKKVVVPVAGAGTRLLSATKEQPKEMLPIFSNNFNGGLSVKPLLQLIFEQLYNIGLREFCLIVGRDKRAIEDHFTPDYYYIDALNNNDKHLQAGDLGEFYKKTESSRILWVNQPMPKGFGDAVLKASSYANEEEFLVHAGDTYIISPDNNHLKRMFEAHKRLEANAILLVQEKEDPRQYGIIEGCEVGKGLYKVSRVVEKPEVPPTNLAIMPVYIFQPKIFQALEAIPLGKDGELQLTDGIQKMIEWGLNVYAVKLRSDEVSLDIGTPETYWDALRLSYSHFKKKAVPVPI